MIGWRRRAKADRENTVSQERLHELVNQTLMENFGPLGSFAITRRSAGDTDDIFHTALARSVARDIVANLAEHGISVRSSLSHAAQPLAPVDAVYVPRQLSRQVSAAAPAAVPALRPAAAAPVPALRPAAAASTPTAVPALRPVAVPAAASAPVLEGPDPSDDDALRSLVAHHRAVTEAAAQKNAEGGWAFAR
jgi:hypothetical protein